MRFRLQTSLTRYPLQGQQWLRPKWGARPLGRRPPVVALPQGAAGMMMSTAPFVGPHRGPLPTRDGPASRAASGEGAPVPPRRLQFSPSWAARLGSADHRTA